MIRSLKRREILRGWKKIQEVYRTGEKINGKFLRCYLRLETGLDEGTPNKPLVCFIVDREIKKAVERNKIKRLLRESYRQQKYILLDQLQKSNLRLLLIFLFSPKKNKNVRLPTYHEIYEDVGNIFQKILEIKT